MLFSLTGPKYGRHLSEGTDNLSIQHFVATTTADPQSQRKLFRLLKGIALTPNIPCTIRGDGVVAICLDSLQDCLQQTFDVRCEVADGEIFRLRFDITSRAEEFVIGALTQYRNKSSPRPVISDVPFERIIAAYDHDDGPLSETSFNASELEQQYLVDQRNAIRDMCTIEEPESRHVYSPEEISSLFDEGIIRIIQTAGIECSGNRSQIFLKVQREMNCFILCILRDATSFTARRRSFQVKVADALAANTCGLTAIGFCLESGVSAAWYKPVQRLLELNREADVALDPTAMSVVCDLLTFILKALLVKAFEVTQRNIVPTWVKNPEDEDDKDSRSKYKRELNAGAALGPVLSSEHKIVLYYSIDGPASLHEGEEPYVEIENPVHSTCARDIFTATNLLLFHGKLAKLAVWEGTKAANRLTDTYFYPNSHLLSTRAGLYFFPEHVALMADRLFPGARLEETAVVCLTGVLEYLCAEILEVSSDAAMLDGRTTITCRHIQDAIYNDDELRKVFVDTVIRRGTFATETAKGAKPVAALSPYESMMLAKARTSARQSENPCAVYVDAATGLHMGLVMEQGEERLAQLPLLDAFAREDKSTRRIMAASALTDMELVVMNDSAGTHGGETYSERFVFSHVAFSLTMESIERAHLNCPMSFIFSVEAVECIQTITEEYIIRRLKVDGAKWAADGQVLPVVEDPEEAIKEEHDVSGEGIAIVEGRGREEGGDEVDEGGEGGEESTSTAAGPLAPGVNSAGEGAAMALSGKENYDYGAALVFNSLGVLIDAGASSSSSSSSFVEAERAGEKRKNYCGKVDEDADCEVGGSRAIKTAFSIKSLVL